MKTVPEFTDAEIQEMMDFKQVLAMTEAAHQRSRKIVRGIVTTVLITGLVGGAMFVYDRYASSESTTLSHIPANTTIPPATTPPATPVPPQAGVPLDTALQSAGPGRTTALRKKPAQQPLTVERKKHVAETKKETTSVVRVDSAKAVSVFLPAEPTDGYPALYEYFAKELHYPELAIKDSIQGVTLVTFVINTQGKPEQVGTDHMLGEAFEMEAIRVIEQMPPWKPAQLDGSPVRSKVSVPITFSVKTHRQQ